MRALRTLLVCCFLAGLSGQVSADITAENSAKPGFAPQADAVSGMLADANAFARSGLILPLPEVPVIELPKPVAPHLSQRKAPVKPLFKGFESIVSKALTLPIAIEKPVDIVIASEKFLNALSVPVISAMEAHKASVESSVASLDVSVSSPASGPVPDKAVETTVPPVIATAFAGVAEEPSAPEMTVRRRTVSEFYDPEFDQEEGQAIEDGAPVIKPQSRPHVVDETATKSDILEKPKPAVLASPTEPSDILTRKIEVPKKVTVKSPVEKPAVKAKPEIKTQKTLVVAETVPHFTLAHDLSALPVKVASEPAATDSVEQIKTATSSIEVVVDETPPETVRHPGDNVPDTAVMQTTTADVPFIANTVEIHDSRKSRKSDERSVSAKRIRDESEPQLPEPVIIQSEDKPATAVEPIEKTEEPVISAQKPVGIKESVSPPAPRKRVVPQTAVVTQNRPKIIIDDINILHDRLAPPVLAVAPVAKSVSENPVVPVASDEPVIIKPYGEGHEEDVAVSEKSDVEAPPSAPESEPIVHNPAPAGTPDLTLTQLRINGSDIIDLEVLVWKDGSVSYPVKAMSQLFLDNAKTLPDGTLVVDDTASHQSLSINIDTQKVLISGTPWTVPGPPVVEKTNGLIIQDDIYAPAALIESFFTVNLSFSPESLIADLTSEKKIYVDSDSLVDNSDTQGDSFEIEDKEISLNTTERKDIVERISYRASNRYNARYSQFRSIYGTSATSQKTASNMQNNFQFQVNGHLAGLPYYVKPDWYSLGSRFSLRSFLWGITKKYRHGDLTLGSLKMGISPVVSPSVSIWGLNYTTANATDLKIDASKTIKISPNTEKNTQVFTQHLSHHFLNEQAGVNNTSENETVSSNLKTTLKSAVTATDNIVADNTSSDDSVSQPDDVDVQSSTTTKPDAPRTRYFADILDAHTKAYSAWLGKNAPRFNPVTLTGSSKLFLPQSNKIVTGARYYYGLTDKLTLGISAAADKIVGKPRTQDLLTTYFTNFTPDLTGLNSYRRDNNYFEGSSFGTSLKYQFAKHFALRGDVAGSFYNQKPGFSLPLPSNATGDAQNLALEYKSKHNDTELNLFRFSPDYYTPSQFIDASTYDRRGVGINTSGLWSKLKLSYQLGYQRYQSNTAARFSGGVINANHYRANVNRTFFKNLNVGGTIDWIDGENTLQKYSLNTTDFFARKPLFNNILLETRFREQETQNIYIPFNSTDSLSRIYNILNSTQSIHSFYNSIFIPFGHENYVKVGQNLSNLISYASVEAHLKLKNVIIEPFVQKSFASIQQEDRIGGRIYYQFPNGTRLGFTYYYNQLNFGNTRYNSHQFYLDLMDVLGVVGTNIVSLGRAGNINSNLVTGKLYIDTNRNSLYDSEEPGIPNVSILVDNTNTFKTNKKGLFVASGLSPGDHSLEVQPDDLPINVVVSSTKYKVSVQKDIKNQEVNIGFTPEGSRIVGHISIQDIDKKDIPIKQMVIYLLDENDKLISYTTTDSAGNYQFSDVPPGKYKVDLSEQTRNSGKYKVITTLPAVNVALDVKAIEPATYEQEDLKLLQLF